MGVPRRMAAPDDRQADGIPRVQPATSASPTHDETAPRVAAPDTLIRFEHVTKFFGEGDKRVHVVDDVSFTARRGEFISILGPSGCGKSTMMMLTSGLIPVSSGHDRDRRHAGHRALYGFGNCLSAGSADGLAARAGQHSRATRVSGTAREGLRKTCARTVESRWACPDARKNTRSSCQEECASGSPSAAR